jgi:hypothetical protein
MSNLVSRIFKGKFLGKKERFLLIFVAAISQIMYPIIAHAGAVSTVEHNSDADISFALQGLLFMLVAIPLCCALLFFLLFILPGMLWESVTSQIGKKDRIRGEQERAAAQEAKAKERAKFLAGLSPEARESYLLRESMREMEEARIDRDNKIRDFRNRNGREPNSWEIY